MGSFNKEINKIVVVHYGNVMLYPPVLNLLENLQKNNYKVVLISGNTKKMPKIIVDSNIKLIDIELINSRNILMRIKRRFGIGGQYKRELSNVMENGDIVWTTTDSTVRALNNVLFKYKHIMQLMELDSFFPLFDGARFLKFDLSVYAKAAWKTVVPEINRAYIQKVQWKLDHVPAVLPNKPYYLEPENMDEKVQKAILELEKDNRKKIMYMGVMSVDRNLEPFAEAVEKLGDDYCLCTLGSIPENQKDKFDNFLKKHPQVRYLGFFNPPNHLHFLKYAYIGLLPYSTEFNSVFISPLNVLYCAPNKIYEYAGYDVPMLGTDVLGLKLPFEKYNIGVCCPDFKSESIVKGIRQIERDYLNMKCNCKMFYEDTNLDSIVYSIIHE